MIEVDIIEKSEVPAEWMEGFKQYASIADNGRDAMLGGLLRLAVLRVQAMADKSLLACTIRVRDAEARSGVRLYQTIGDISSVKDGEGNDLDHTFDGRTVYVASHEAVVTYTTKPLEDAADELLPVVYQYATALYDGQDSKSLANILAQCR